ncbi:MAG: ferredoxin [Spirochaetia bacterium]|nr:ferredoxin [Spirochaetia bacterium]
MSKIVYVEKDDCTSCSLCADTLPEYFRMDEDDVAESHNDTENINAAVVPDDDMDKVQETIDDCPGECILWKE